MAPDLIIDMRCLQDAARSERGVPGHAAATIRLARRVSAWARTARIVGIVDHRMPALAPELAALADEVRGNAYMPSPPPGSLLLNPAPMGPDQDVLGRLLLDPRIAKAAVVYDFIPLDQPARYLGDPVHRLEYSTALVWLRRYQLFLPISAATGARLGALWPEAVNRVVTGVPLSLFGGAETVPAAPARHLLMVGGDDPRKNPEVLIRAHAGSADLQAAQVPLIVTGAYAPERRAELRAEVLREGGNPTLLQLPGRLPAAALRAAYRAAYCVITPSLAEGFSLPVVEAMAAGVASIGSDIDAHAELLPDPAWRFDSEDPAALRRRLEALVRDGGARDAMVAAQAGIWPPFKPETVARTIWAAIETLVLPPPAPAVVLGRRPRIAVLSPLPPALTGVADFSARFAAALALRAEVELFAAGSRGAGAVASSGAPFLSARFDRVVTAQGNSPHYAATYQLMKRYGGACVCHDHRLLGFCLGQFGAERTAAMASRELGRPVSAGQVTAWAFEENDREADLMDDLAAAARPLIFHNRHSVAALRTRGFQAEFLPFAIYRPWSQVPVSAAAQRDARARLGLADGRLIASFGFVGVLKGVEAALRALALLRDNGMPCHMVWVGDASGELRVLRRLARRHRVTELVTFHSTFFTEAKYRDYLLAADFGLQLRIGRPGSVSGALQDCIAAGLPSVANDDLADNVEAPDYVRRVGDALDPVAIADAFAGLIEAGLPRGGYEEARRKYCARHSMDNYVDGLFKLLEL